MRPRNPAGLNPSTPFLDSHWIIPAVLAVGTLLFYVVDLGHAPIYLHPAEVLFALQAHAIATTAHDLSGRLLPLYFQMAPIGANVWFQPVIVYFIAPFLRVLPMTEWAVRFPSAIVGVIDVVLIYLVALRLLNGKRWAVTAAVLLALTPAHFIHSRVAMDYLYPVPFVLVWLLCLLRYLDRPRARMLFLATSVLGLGVYSYIASVIMMPFYLALTWVALFEGGERSKRPYIIATAGFVWPLALVVFWLSRHPSIVTETLSRYELGSAVAASEAAGRFALPTVVEQLRQPLRFFNITGRVSLYWYFFDPSYLFVMGSYANIINSTRRVGVFLVPLLVFVPAGIGYLVTARRRLTAILLIVGFLSAPLAAVLVVPEPYAIDRELVLLPFAVLIATFGVRAMLLARTRMWRIAAAGLLALIPLHFAFFCTDYWRDYPLRVAYWFEGDHRAALETMIARQPTAGPSRVYFSEGLPYIDAYWRFYLIKNHRQDLLGRTIYLKSDDNLAAVTQPGSLLLVRDGDGAAAALVRAGRLRPVAVFPEPGNAPIFALFER
jgi:4-amino-4-deoxy-L-arabinose transferase-like glycosyltransferase